jgi:CheY-like chemotaxis protein
LDWQPRDGLYAGLTVTDTGCGIDAADIEKLFDPFFTSKFLGRGLGLPIVLGIVRAHCGGVTVASKTGQGSVFSVFLPIFAGEISRPPQRLIKGLQVTGGTAVLVVDDDPMLREIAQAALTHLGYEVLVAKDGIEAMAVFKQHRASIGCVLCDIVMPRMDGWETLSALRRLAPDLPVILSSGYDQVQVMAGDHADLPQYFLGKPYDLAGLRGMIQQALAGSGTEPIDLPQEE